MPQVPDAQPDLLNQARWVQLLVGVLLEQFNVVNQRKIDDETIFSIWSIHDASWC
jgi:hypothetical protein